MKNQYLILIVIILFQINESRSEEIIISQKNYTVIVINKGIWANCASKFEADLAICEDHLSIIERDTSYNKAYCECTFNFETRIDSLPNGFYTLNIYREFLKQYSYPKDTVIFIGSATILIDKYSGIFPVEYMTNQSDCYDQTGIDNNYIKTKLNQPELYPNPAKDFTSIKFYSNESGNADFGIYTSSGINIVNYYFKNINVGNNVKELILKDINPGIYIIRISVNGRINSSQKLTILK
jgi:hypothetical protein